jgi:hypothetical protein
MDRLLIRQVLAVSALGALALMTLRAGSAVLTVAGLVLAIATTAGVAALVRVVVISERKRMRR